MKILEISGKLNIGGAQAVAANIAKYSGNAYSFVYVVFGEDIGEYEAEIEARGDKIIHTDYPSRNEVAFFKTIMKIMREENIDVVHCHTMYNCGIVMLAAKLAGVRGRISHSHTTKDETYPNLKRRIYIFAMRMLILLFGTEWFACGAQAGETLYGKRWFNKHGRIIHNGVDVEKYRYDENTRSEIRKRLGVENSFVIGHVGHYVKVKNQSLLIEAMPRILEMRPDAKLLMFGDGPYRELLQERINKYGIADKALLMGNTDNIHKILSAFDVFAFPSFYEGTPLALIEAQANGLPCVISDAIPEDACITESIIKLPADNIGLWTEKLIGALRGDSQKNVEVIMEKYGDTGSAMAEIYTSFDKYKRMRDT